MPRLPFLALAVVALPRLALADPQNGATEANVDNHVTVVVNVTEPPPPPPPDPTPSPPYQPDAGPPGPVPHPLNGQRWEAEIAFEGLPMRGLSAGDVSGSSAGLMLSLGRQIGPLRLAGEYSVAKISGQRDLYASVTTPWGTDTYWDGWQDVGAESSRIGLTARLRAVRGMPGANLDGYLEAGIGRDTVRWDDGGVFQRDDVAVGAGFEMGWGQHHMAGFDLGFRFLVAPTPRPTSIPACSGTCMPPAADGTHDVSVVFHAGLLLGN